MFLIIIVVLICWRRSKGEMSEDDPTSRTRGVIVCSQSKC